VEEVMQVRASFGMKEELGNIEFFVVETSFKLKAGTSTPYDFLIHLINNLQPIPEQTFEILLSKSINVITLILLCIFIG
jgi:hypothetical protein